MLYEKHHFMHKQDRECISVLVHMEVILKAAVYAIE